jgi:hypothetical protein
MTTPSPNPRVNFVHRGIAAWRDVAAESGRTIPDSELGPRLRLGREIWIVQAFHRLRARGYPVRLTGEAEPDCINVLHADDFAGRPPGCFVVCVRADRDPRFDVDVEIVQNRGCVWKENDVYIPHFPQPGIVPRNPARGSEIHRVVYLGKEVNLAPDLRAEAFASAIERLGMRLIVREDRWWDYSDVDVVLAVRTGIPLYLNAKPSSKLVNAWLGDCPALVGPERGYREIRTSSLDFMECWGADQVLRGLRRLREEPRLYEDMVENGRARRSGFTTAAVTDRWEEVVRGVLVPRYLVWQRAPRSRGGWWVRARQRLWGTQVVQDPPPAARSALNWVRRAVALPRSVPASRRLHGDPTM